MSSAATDFNVTGQSSGWAGAIAGSTFTLETQQVLVPANSVRMRFVAGFGRTRACHRRADY